MRHPVSIGCRAALSLILLSLVFSAPASAERLQGKFRKGVYTAPTGLFTVQSPLGARPVVDDGYGGIPGLGMVSFSNDRAEMYNVMYGPFADSPEVESGYPVTTGTDLETWFRDVMFPPAFEGLLPGSTILRSEAGEFEGQPAWIAIVHMPRGHVITSRTFAQAWLAEPGRRMDSWCGIVVIRHQDHGYILMKELNDQLAGIEKFKLDPEATDWNAFVPRLAEFYRGVQFLKP